MRKRDGTFETAPGADAPVEAGDILNSVGTADELAALESVFTPERVVAGH